MNLHGCQAQIGGFQILKIGSSSHLLGRSQPHRGKHHLQVERSAILTFEFYMSYIHAKHSVMCHLEPDKNVLLTTPVSESSSESVASMNDVSRLNRGESVKKSQTFSNVRFGFLELHSVMIFSPFLIPLCSWKSNSLTGFFRPGSGRHGQMVHNSIVPVHFLTINVL